MDRSLPPPQGKNYLLITGAHDYHGDDRPFSSPLHATRVPETRQAGFAFLRDRRWPSRGEQSDATGNPGAVGGGPQSSLWAFIARSRLKDHDFSRLVIDSRDDAPLMVRDAAEFSAETRSTQFKELVDGQSDDLQLRYGVRSAST